MRPWGRARNRKYVSYTWKRASALGKCCTRAVFVFGMVLQPWGDWVKGQESSESSLQRFCNSKLAPKQRNQKRIVVIVCLIPVSTDRL